MSYEFIPEEFVDEVTKLRILIKLSGQRIHFTYETMTYKASSHPYGLGSVHPATLKWRLRWFDNESDAYNGFNRRRAAFKTFEGLRNKVIQLMAIL